MNRRPSALIYMVKTGPSTVDENFRFRLEQAIGQGGRWECLSGHAAQDTDYYYYNRRAAAMIRRSDAAGTWTPFKLLAIRGPFKSTMSIEWGWEIVDREAFKFLMSTIVCPSVLRCDGSVWRTGAHTRAHSCRPKDSVSAHARCQFGMTVADIVNIAGHVDVRGAGFNAATGDGGIAIVLYMAGIGTTQEQVGKVAQSC